MWSRYQRPDLHRWTWYNNAGWVAKEINHILDNTRWRIFQNCRVFLNAEFFDHRLVVATLKLHVKSRKILSCNHNVFHFEKLKNFICAHEYAVTVSNQFEVLDALENPVELCNTFKHENLKTTWACFGGVRGHGVGMLDSLEKRRAATLARNQD